LNHLVDYDSATPVSELSNIRFSIGEPYFTEYVDCGYADLWLAEREDMLGCVQRQDMAKAGANS
jgi:hypothetical protein